MDKAKTAKLLIENIRLPISAGEDEAVSRAKRMIRSAGCFGQAYRIGINKRSVDARHKDRITAVYSVYAECETRTDKLPDSLGKYGIKPIESEQLVLPEGNEKMDGRPVVIGFGPAGIFCSLILARCGFAPLVLERGDRVEKRTEKVGAFLAGGSFDPETNVQFGAGGAGTFSDGKLTTRISDKRCSFVTEEMIRLGAPADIAVKAKPHIGTDVLRRVIANANDEIIRLGGEIRYLTKVDKIADGYVTANGEAIKYGVLVIATGHSARDIYSGLISSGFMIEPKPFSAGVRIEHLQSDIDYAMYGELAGKYGLCHADYALSMRRGGKGVYSFCMCPGGTVVAAASEDGGVVTNGMSDYARDGKNANAAIAVSIDPCDYGDSPLGAIEFQRKLERAAFEAGGRTFAAPCQTFGDFKAGTVKHEPKRIMPTYRSGNVVMTDIGALLPPFITSMLKDGIADFGRKIKGFDADDVPLTGIETRTSAPVRIMREGDLTAVGHGTVYPCGEGAGYAGGIMSAAVDGIKVAEAILAKYRRN